jgi:hypothetical protein
MFAAFSCIWPNAVLTEEVVRLLNAAPRLPRKLPGGVEPGAV